jgi:hypothetical protein
VDAQADLDALVNFLMPFAQETLGKHGEFFPFAAQMSVDGEITAIDIETDDEDHPDSDVVIGALGDVLRTHAADGMIRACGICSDTAVTIPEKGMTEAVRVSLEHAEAEPVDVYMPYKTEAAEYVFEDLVAMEGVREIFAGPDMFDGVEW